MLKITLFNYYIRRYEFTATYINHLIVTFIPVNYNLISRFKVDEGDKAEDSRLIKFI